MVRLTWRRSKRLARSGLQYLIGFALLAWILQTIDLDRVLQTTGELSAGSIALVVILTFFQLVPVRWYVLVAAYERPRLRSLFTIDLTVRFVNSVFPSRVSGASVTPILLRRHTSLDTADATAVTGALTSLYAICYGLCCIAGLLVFGGQFGPTVLAIVLVSTAVYLGLGLGLVATAWRFSDVIRIVERVTAFTTAVPRVGTRIEGFLSSGIDALRGGERSFRSLVSRPRTMGWFAAAFCASGLMFPGLRLWVIMTSLGDTAPLALFPLYVIVAYSVTILPLTPGGIGVTEATAVVVLTAVGLSHEIAVSAVLIDRAFGVYLPALIGWYPSLSLDLSG